MSLPRCLIISDHTDYNAHAVSWGLKVSGIEPCWLKSGSLADPELPVMAWAAGGGEPLQGLRNADSKRWLSVLFRRHRAPANPSAADRDDQRFVEQEWAALQRSIWAVGEQALEALWVNAPAASIRAENKLVQLEEVRHCGLDLPETLVGNDPEAILDFVATRPKTVYKPFLPFGWEVGDKRCHTPATILPRADQIDPRTLSLCPGIYQSCIDKRADWRVTVIGERIYPARITADANIKEIDWRPTILVDGATRCSTGELPASVIEGIRRLMGRLGLVYGAIDLVEDLDGQFWFLEVNQVGQFLFVEHLLPELPLLQSFCAMLAEGRVDYDPDSCRGVSLAAFSRTPEQLIACDPAGAQRAA